MLVLGGSLNINRTKSSFSLLPLCLIGGSTLAFAQDGAKLVTEKWRPQNGIYAVMGKDFTERCKSGDFSVELGENNVTGDEWSCDVKGITDIGPKAIRLDMSCTDDNLEPENPDHRKDPAEPIFRETMTFRKIDDKSVYIRKSQNGKTNFPETKAGYCPPSAQRAYRESKTKEQVKER